MCDVCEKGCNLNQDISDLVIYISYMCNMPYNQQPSLKLSQSLKK